MKAGILSTMMLFFAGTAQAQSLEIGEITHGGNGCPDGSVQLVVSPENPEIATFAFKPIVTEAGASLKRTIDRKSCNVAVSINVPKGLRVALLPPNLHGSLKLSRKATAQVRLEVFFAGGRGPILEKTFTGPIQAPLVIDQSSTSDELAWSPCGEDVILRSNLSLTLKSPGRRSVATIEQVNEGVGLVAIAIDQCDD